MAGNNMARIHVGTSGWSYKDWVGNFYPDGAQPKDYLKLYTASFDTVEIDSTFYGIPRKSTIESWYKTAPKNFKFTPKLPQEITHKSDLTGIEDTLNGFLGTISILKEKLGPILIQFPYSFTPQTGGNLGRFIDGLPTDFDFVIEIRNRKWLGEKFYDMLRKRSIGLALLDHPWMPKVQVVTSKVLYVRFLGDRNQIPDNFTHERNNREKELREWQRIIAALEEKVDDFYGYFNNHYSGHSPLTAKRFLEILRNSE
jgi:uncharacterized protein YecE (DUF72 family)